MHGCVNGLKRQRVKSMFYKPGDLLLKLRETIQKHNMLKEGDRVVVGVSGGPDSTALIHLLCRLKQDYKLGIWIAHLNHELRSEAKEEAEWVKRFASQLKVPIILDSLNVALIAKEKKMSVEMAAREVRYNFFERVANEVRATKIALGHTASDQVETLLMRLIRGTGLDGLTGIPPIRGKIIRPLINIFREEIEKYCQIYNLYPCRDSSNQKLFFFRNKIRLRLIPFICREYNPQFNQVLFQTADILREERKCLDEIAERILKKLILKRSDRQITINAEKLLSSHPLALQRRVIRKLILEVKGNLKNVSFIHIDKILKLRSDKGTKIINLPGDIIAKREYHQLVIEKREQKYPSFFSSLSVPGKTILSYPGFLFESEVSYKKSSCFSSDPYCIQLDWDKLPDSLFLRGRKKGDKFQPLGMKGEKKLKDFFIDLKIPLQQRDKIPILVSGKRIVWVVGYRIDDRFKVDEHTNRILRIKATYLPQR